MNSYKYVSAAVVALLMTSACMAEVDGQQAGVDTASLTVEVSKIRNNDGRVMLALYDHKEAFNAADEVRAYASMSSKVVNSHLRVTFENLPASRYAAVIFHDENGNGAFDMKRGEPIEGYGVSGALHALDEPTFKKASVLVGDGKQTIAVKMHYYK